jgi:hypothetical protein
MKWLRLLPLIAVLLLEACRSDPAGPLCDAGADDELVPDPRDGWVIGCAAGIEEA